MTIESYTNTVTNFYIGLFLLLIPVSFFVILRKAQKRHTKCWWLIPLGIIYSTLAMISTFVASIAYDDPADPNYQKYQNWKLLDFIFHDIKMLIVLLFIIGLLYFVFERKSSNKILKTICSIILIALAVLLIISILLTITFS